MKAVLIILIIIAVLLILLMLPIRVKLDYGDITRLKVGWFFLSFTLIPAKEKKPKKKKQPEKKQEQKEKPEEKQPGRVKKLLDKHGIDGLIDILKELVAVVVNVLKKLARHLYFTRFNVRICVVGENAADTAVKYGYVCSAVYPLIAVLSEHSVIKKHSEDISACFLAEKTSAELELTAKIRPLFLIPIAVGALIKLVGILTKL